MVASTRAWRIKESRFSSRIDPTFDGIWSDHRFMADRHLVPKPR